MSSARIPLFQVAIVAAATLALASACGAAPIAPPGDESGATTIDPRVTIPATDDVRAALAVIERYRQALKHGDTNALLALAAPDYHDEAGTASPDDDIGRDALAAVLARWNQIALLGVDLRVVSFDRRGADLVLRVELHARIRVSGRTSTIDEDHEMWLTRQGQSWRFRSGM